MNQRNRIDQAALEAHRRGLTWGEFFQGQRAQFDELPAADRQQAIERALQIVTTGEVAGMVPVANSMFGWDEMDVDQAQPAAAVGDVAIDPCRSLAALTLPWARGRTEP